MLIRSALLLLCCVPAWATAASAERTRIAQERQALSQHYAAQERACTQRFAVTACVDDVRSRRREAVAPLRERELQLDEAERVQRAEQRRAVIAGKRAAAAAQPAPAPPPELRLRDPGAAPAPAPTASAVLRAPRSESDVSARAEEAEQRVQQAQQRARDAELVRQRIARREAERRARGIKPAPLPRPTAASAAAP